MIYEVKTLEQDLTAFFACRLGLVVDSAIFRGEIPDGIENGVALRVMGTSEPANNDNPLYSVQIIGKFLDRDDAWKLGTKIYDMIPFYGEQTEHFHLVFVRPDSGLIPPIKIDDKGKTKHFASINLAVSVLTKRA